MGQGSFDEWVAERLSGVSSRTRARFVRELVRKQSTSLEESRKWIEDLIAKGASAPALLEVVLKVEWMQLQRILREQKHAPEAQAQELTSCVRRFSTWQLAIAEAAERIWERALAREKMQRWLAEAEVRWLKAGEVELVQYFKEVPIRAKVKLMRLQDATMEVACSEQAMMVFAASQDLRTAYVPVAGELRLRVRGLRREGTRLVLALEGLEPNLFARRRHVRVQLEEPAPILLQKEARKIAGWVRDQSLFGLGVILAEKVGIGVETHAPLAVGGHVRCAWEHTGAALDAEGVVRWVHKIEEGWRAGIEITPTAATQQRLQKIVMEHQRAVIQRLQTLGVPSWMEEKE